jgi:hypothetical protein
MVPYPTSKYQSTHLAQFFVPPALFLKYRPNCLVQPLPSRSSILVLLAAIGFNESQEQKKNRHCQYGQTNQFHQEVLEILVLRR